MSDETSIASEPTEAARNYVAVTTVREIGAADLLRGALTEQGIPVEIRRVGQNPYFASLTGIEMEVRVPEGELAAAESVLARLAGESEEALLGEAPRALTAEEQEVADEAREAPPPARLKSPVLGAVYAIFVPVLGPIYGGAPLLALASLLIHLPLFYMLFGPAHADRQLLLFFWGMGRFVDLTGTQKAITVYNDALQAAHGAAAAPDHPSSTGDEHPGDAEEAEDAPLA